MLMTADYLNKFITTTDTDEALQLKLSAIEQSIRSYTNNNFQVRGIRYICSVIDGKIVTDLDIKHLKQGDTIEMTSDYNSGLYVIDSIENNSIIVDKELMDEDNAMITLVRYPDDVKLGCVNLIKWELENRDKVGVSSETISRHTVSYFNMDGTNSLMGYPRSLLGFLKPYRKVRF